MATELKEMFNLKFYQKLAATLNKVTPFEQEAFIAAAINSIENRSLNERLRHTTILLKKYLDTDFNGAVTILDSVITQMPTGYTTLIFPDFIGQYGQNDFETSMKALAFYTQFGSSEFAIREFLKTDFDATLAVMMQWTQSPNHHIRRLATEGCRPRLPWATALPELKKNPSPILPLLERLKADESEYVRRSVANNLNDIAKDHPEKVIAIAKKWLGNSNETNALVKHACRTLLKQGNKDVLQLFGLDASQITVANLVIETPQVAIGNQLSFSFELKNIAPTSQKIRLEYAIYYLRQNQQLSKKVYKISERIYEANQTEIIKRNQSFKIITTRKFYTGKQLLSIIVNGDEKISTGFELIDTMEIA